LLRETSLNVGFAVGNVCATSTDWRSPFTSTTAAVRLRLGWLPDVDAVVLDELDAEAVAPPVVAGAAVVAAPEDAVPGAAVETAGTSGASVTCWTNGSLLSNVSNETNCDFVWAGGRSESANDLLAATAGVAAVGVALVGVVALDPVTAVGCTATYGAEDEEPPCNDFNVRGPRKTRRATRITPPTMAIFFCLRAFCA
jgi:hypothetical protein